jgi:cation diffusion facilitator CzcD-associated flavoprotein CzcO
MIEDADQATQSAQREHMEQFDVIVVGAGLSGIGAAVRLATMCPGKSVLVLEGRASMGGTWDLFRYPGVRSDSDMFTLSYPFRPWDGRRAIADGGSILRYLRATAEEFGIDGCIRFRQRVTGASWSSDSNRWTVEAVTGDDGQVVRYTANFLYLCTGYYSYEVGHLPDFPGVESFKGQLVHPQHWPEGLSCQNQRVIVIGSGATAVTLAPALAAVATRVTVLQRSPSYVISVPSVDPLAELARRALLPPHATYLLLRWKNVVLGTAFYQLCRRRPETAGRLLRTAVARQLPEGYHVDPDFSPRYRPWDQRMCVTPDGDLFEAIRGGRLEVVTDEIEAFCHDGIRLTSGRMLVADVVIAATGLELIPCGGIRLAVDGADVDPGQTVIYRGFMLSGLPNLAVCLGYTNASWTLRADLTSRSVCRLLQTMDRAGHVRAVPQVDGRATPRRPLLDLNSGYISRAADRLPKQGGRPPWRLRQNYILDLLAARFGYAADRLSFSGAGAAEPVPGDGLPST